MGRPCVSEMPIKPMGLGNPVMELAWAAFHVAAHEAK